MSQLESKSLRKIIEENTERGFIWESKSLAGALVTFMKKKNGELHVCIDYRQLNTITVKNRYPLPLITELLDRIRGACYFTKLNLQGTYNLVCIKEGDEWKMAFCLWFGHFEWLVMPLSLTNAPAAFQGLMNDILRECLDCFTSAFLDDIIIYYCTLEEHKRHVTEVL